MSVDYRIEKDRIAVVVTTMGGDRIVGDLFVQTYTRHRMGREEAPDVLNGAEPFFPLSTEDGETFLIAKDNVREVQIPGPVDEELQSAVGARTVELELYLTGGTIETGAVFLEVPMDRPRLLDFLNRVHDRFLTLYAPDGVRLVNRRLIERARPLE